MYRILIVCCAVAVIAAVGAMYFFSENGQTSESYIEVSEDDPEAVLDGIHLRTGLKEGEGLQSVINNCTSCHSAKLIQQHRLSREGWVEVIRWMQETQNLWDLGEQEQLIVDYLSEHYPPVEKGRRQPLENIEWYALE